MSVKQLQAQLGHSKVEITLDVYTSITDEQRKDTANQYISFVNFWLKMCILDAYFFDILGNI